MTNQAVETNTAATDVRPSDSLSPETLTRNVLVYGVKPQS